MDTYKINTLGTFENKDVENAFLEHEKHYFNYYNALTILLGGILYFLVAIADYVSKGLCSIFYFTAFSRFAYLLSCVVMYVVIKRGAHLKTSIRLMFVNTLANFSLLAWVIMLLNPDHQLDLIDQITIPIILLMTLIFAQIPLKFLLVTAAYGLSLFIILLVGHFRVTVVYFVNFFSMIVALISIGLFLSRFLNTARRKEYTHTMEVEMLNNALFDEMEERNQTRLELEKVYRELKDSLKYAQSLQMTLMPQDDEFERVFPSSFVLLRPREDVSGDFYWVREVGSKAIVVVADCTGHGIPGAFMSILGITLIQMITKQFDEKQLDAALILSLLQKEVIETMKVSNEARARKDGMDISLCVVDKQRMTLQFAGAFSDLWVVRSQSQQVMKIKGVKMPVGIHQKYYEIINHDIQLSPGDTIYLLTDGYKDQFGGNRGKRFMSKNLEELVLSLQRLTMTEQRKYLSNSFIKWKNGYTQVDDMLIIGIKF